MHRNYIRKRYFITFIYLAYSVFHSQAVESDSTASCNSHHSFIIKMPAYPSQNPLPNQRTDGTDFKNGLQQSDKILQCRVKLKMYQCICIIKPFNRSIPFSSGYPVYNGPNRAQLSYKWPKREEKISVHNINIMCHVMKKTFEMGSDDLLL